MQEQNNKPDLKEALITWCEKHKVDIKDLAQALGYSYQAVWNILRGGFPVSIETVGRFALAYGPDLLNEWLDMAGCKYEFGVLPLPEGGNPVPVLDIKNQA